MPRSSYDDSCRVLQKLELIASGKIPRLRDSSPRHDEEDPGVSFFRTELADVKLEHLTLPRTFFNRSEIRHVSFRDTDLSESTANWNDFMEVNFKDADLSRSDFRACVFKNVRFTGTMLVGVDFRYCGFSKCDFSNADLTDAKLTVKTGKSLRLSPEQQSVINWHVEEGEEPEGN